MAGARTTAKFDFAALRTIGEVAEGLDLPQHVLRFWETRFKEIDPVKRAGGRRFYSARDVELVAAIRHLLYREGYTIKGVQRILKEQGVDAVIEDLRRRLDDDAAAALPPLRQVGAAPTEETLVATPLAEAMRPAALDLTEPEEAENSFETRDEPPEAVPLSAPVAMAASAPPAPIEPVVVIRRLDETDARTLRAALAEIEECKRLLKLTQR